MLAIPAALVWASLGQVPAAFTPAENSVAATRPAEGSPTPPPSTEREAALQSTLEHRRAYLRSIRGNAHRQRARYGPSWSFALARARYMATTVPSCSDE